MSLTPRIDRIDKKYVINGSFPYWQRKGALVAVDPQLPTPAYDYKAPDRFLVEATNFTGTPALVRSNNTIAGANYKTSLSLAGDFAAGCTFGLKTRIESIFAHDLINQATSTQFAVRSNNFQSATIYIRYADALDNFATTTLAHTLVFPLSTLDDWNILTFNNKILGTAATNGVEIEILFNNESVVGAGTLFVSGIQMNVGDVAQEFSIVGRDLVEEFKLCKRFYATSYNLDSVLGTITTVNAVGTQSAAGNHIVNNSFAFSELKRDIPVITAWNPSTGLPGTWRDVSGGINISPNFENVGNDRFSINQNINGGRRYIGHWEADSEL